MARLKRNFYPRTFAGKERWCGDTLGQGTGISVTSDIQMLPVVLFTQASLSPGISCEPI